MGQYEDEFDAMMNRAPAPDYDAEFEALSRRSKGPKQYTRYSGGNSGIDPDKDPVDVPTRTFHLGVPPEADSARIGFKELGTDREAAARELYPDARIYRDKDDTVTVQRPDGTVYNFERPDYGHAIAGAVRGVANIRNAGTPWGAEEDELREGLVGDLIRQNAAAALPNIASRGAANTAVAALTGGASLPVQAAAYGVGNAVVPVLNSEINEHTAGGDTQTGGEIGQDALIDGLIGTGSVLIPGIPGAVARRYSSAGRMNRALAELLHEEGQANPELARQLALTGEALPIQSLQRDGNELLLQRRLRNPKIAQVQGAAEENVARMGDDARVARETAQRGSEDANTRVLEATLRAQEQVRLARNTARVATNSADEAAADMTARDSARRAAQDAEYHGKVTEQNENFAADSHAHAEQVAKQREAHAQEKLRFNKARAKEATNRAMINNDIDDQVAAAKENYAGRYAQNRVAELEEGRPGAVEKFVPPQKPTPPVKPTRPAKPAKPARAPKEARPVADPFQEPAHPELDAAKLEAKTAKTEAARTDRAHQSIDDLQKSLKKSLRKVQTAKSDTFSMGKNVVRMGAAYATGGKTLALEALYRGGKALFSNRATLKILSNPKLLRQAEELAASGERLKNDPTAAEEFIRQLGPFIEEANAD